MALESASMHYPEATTELTNWKNDYQLLICIILSAQTTDKQVNKVTANLFKEFPTLESLKSAKQSDVEALVKSINYYRTKAKNIIKASSVLIGKYSGKVPTDIDDLISLPGVGYKTANVFISEFYREGKGVAVDTHVMRVFQRLGLTDQTDPTKIAKELEKLYPKKDWHRINSTFVLFGRYVCMARKPKCPSCLLREFCAFYNPRKSL